MKYWSCYQIYKINKKLATCSAEEEDSKVWIVTPDNKMWTIHDVTSLHDDGSNLLIDYAWHIFEAIRKLSVWDKESGVAIMCDAGMSRSNAIALGVLVQHFEMDFYGAMELIRTQVPIADIDPSHISALKQLFGVTVP